VARQTGVQLSDCLERLTFLLAAFLVSLAEPVFDFLRPVAWRGVVAVLAIPEESKTFPAVPAGESGPQRNDFIDRFANSDSPVFQPHEENLIDFRQPSRRPAASDIRTYHASAFHLQTPLLHIVCLDCVHALRHVFNLPLADGPASQSTATAFLCVSPLPSLGLFPQDAKTRVPSA
jgi:hypothetical protein